MSRRRVDIDDDALASAREALGTHTIKDTVDAALREATAVAARRREIERLTSGSLSALASKRARSELWR